MKWRVNAIRFNFLPFWSFIAPYKQPPLAGGCHTRREHTFIYCGLRALVQKSVTGQWFDNVMGVGVHASEIQFSFNYDAPRLVKTYNKTSQTAWWKRQPPDLHQTLIGPCARYPVQIAKYQLVICATTFSRWFLTVCDFLKSLAHLRIVAEIGAGSYVCLASTSHKGGIHFSTEYGYTSIRLQSPRIAECNVRIAFAYSGSLRSGNLVRLTVRTNRS